ncbi:hypothetical protein [Pedobacter immunditicola]|uniref:hypothetical protein n=1 Tax=Pedobacter immunditicola TaxID=3133440 RepID=UPI0030AA45B8
MSLKKYRLFIVIIFLGIFSSKMLISVAPVFVAHLDKEIMNDVIMQVELEHGNDSDSGKSVKLVDCKQDLHPLHAYLPLRYHFHVNNSFIEHFKRYVNPFHPSVPTPPPNLV